MIRIAEKKVSCRQEGINYNGKIFTPQSNTENGDLSSGESVVVEK